MYSSGFAANRLSADAWNRYSASHFPEQSGMMFVQRTAATRAENLMLSAVCDALAMLSG